MFEWVWDEEIWFPHNSTGPRYGWKDLENQPGSGIYHPQVRDLHWSFVMGVVLIGVRYVLKKLFVEPIGYYIGVSRLKLPPLSRNSTLEKAYKQYGKVGSDLIERLAKQTDKTTRQVEAWFHIRRKYDAPSPMKKFEDCSWHFVFYSTAFLYGLYVLWDKQWFWETKYCWFGWPHIHISNDIYWYYIIEMAFYWSLVLSLAKDHKRKDFTELVIHHVVTIVLLYFSWFMNLVRHGALVLIVHDASDPWLAATKMFKYIKYKHTAEFCFVVFTIAWIISRLGLFPFVVLYSTTFDAYYVIEKTFFTHWFFNFFLYVLMVLHIMWSYSIGRIIVNRLTKGEADDVRSDADSDEDFNNTHNARENYVNGTQVPNNANGIHADIEQNHLAPSSSERHRQVNHLE